MRLIRKFTRHIGGNFAVTAALAMVPLMAATGLAVDFVSAHNKKSLMQELADGAALAAAKEMSISSLSKDEKLAVVDAYVTANFGAGATEAVKASIRDTGDDSTIGVDLALTWKPFFGHYLDQTIMPIRVNATATFKGDRSNICILSLDGSDAGSLDMTSKAAMTAQGCGVYANSTSANAMIVGKHSKLAGSSIFIAGGYSGNLANFSQQPIIDAPPVPDPLSSRPAPTVGMCDHKSFSVTSGSVTIKPGVYCGGLDIGDKAVVTADPGTYIIKDGPLSVRGNGTIKGEHVGFYFTGAAALFDFGVSTQVNLTAPKSGPLAGIIFYEDRNSVEGRTFTIRSKDAERFEGVVYLPKGTLWIDKASRVGQQSNWTAIITNKISIGNGPDIVVKSDYGASDVPVPEGIEGTTTVRLTD